MKASPAIMKVPSVDLKAQHTLIRGEIQNALSEVLESQQFILGPKVEALEREIAQYCETPFAVGVASGTDALLLALRAVGLERGDEVITTPFTFFATAGAIHNLGAVPVFVDIEAETFNLNPAQIEARITARTKVVIPVHLFGQPVEMRPLLEIARRHHLKVVEDAAQSIGAQYQLDEKWRRAGSLGDAGCISFFPSKNLGGLGDGGMVVTADATIRDRVLRLRTHGGRTRYIHEEVGYNSRLDALQAVALSVKLKYLEAWHAARRERAAFYTELLAQKKLTAKVKPPVIASYARSVFNQYVVRVESRDALQKFLAERGVSTAVYYPRPLHLQPCFEYLGYPLGAFPASEKAAAEVLALPLYPELTREMQEYVVSQIFDFYAR